MGGGAHSCAKLYPRGLPENPPSTADMLGGPSRGARLSLLLTVLLWPLWSGPWGGPRLGETSPRVASASPQQT